MLLLDASGSMGETLPGGGVKMTAAKAAMHDVVGGLPDDQRVGLRVFGATRSKSSGQACTDSQRIADLGTGNRPALDAAIDRVKPFGETPIGYALQQAGRDLGASGQRTVVLVSDGEPTCTPDPCPVAADLAKDGVSLRIDVVGLDVDGDAREALQCIAEKGQGHYYDADSADELTDALDTTATRAAQPFGETGKPVRGTTVQQGAPLIGPGDWLDRLGSSEGDEKTRYYRVHRTVDGSTLHVSADTLLRGENDVLSIGLTGPTGTLCDQKSGTGLGSAYDPLLLASISVPHSLDGSQASCAQAGDYILRVTHGFQGISGGNTTEIPVELKVREEAPVQDVTSLPEAGSTPRFTELDAAAKATGAVGGRSLAAATPIAPGAISGTIVPGEVQAFSVPVGWGQSLAAEVRPSISPALGREFTDGPSPTLAVKILSPSRSDARGAMSGAITGSTQARRGNSNLYSSNDGIGIYEFTSGVAYRNRFSNDSTLSSASEAGRYLVVVSLRTATGTPSKSYAVPFTLATAVRGSVSGSPVYAAGGSTGDLGQPSDTASSGGASSGGSSGSGGSDRAGGTPRAVDPLAPVRFIAGVGALSLGGIAVLAGLVVVLVVTLRRRAERS